MVLPGNPGFVPVTAVPGPLGVTLMAPYVNRSPTKNPTEFAVRWSRKWNVFPNVGVASAEPANRTPASASAPNERWKTVIVLSSGNNPIVRIKNDANSTSDY